MKHSEVEGDRPGCGDEDIAFSWTGPDFRRISERAAPSTERGENGKRGGAIS
jgi:hypothetical protein